MIFDLPIGLLISTRQRELGITTAEIARRVGYRNIGKGIRRINELCQGDFRAAQFIVAGLPTPLNFPRMMSGELSMRPRTSLPPKRGHGSKKRSAGIGQPSARMCSG